MDPAEVIQEKTEPPCVNLQQRFGKHYRIGWEAVGVTRYQWPEADRVWLMQIECRYGLIYPKGGDILQAMSDRPNIRTKLGRLPCVIDKRGDVETVIRFHVDDIQQVLDLLRPYRRRLVSEAERSRLREMGVSYRFKKGSAHGVQDDPSGLGRTQAAG